MNTKKRMELFQEMLISSYNAYFWTYAESGECLNTNCVDFAPFERIFTFTGCKQYMLDYAAFQSQPLILDAPLGMKWAAVFDTGQEKSHLLYVMGPILISSVSEQNAYQRICSFNLELAGIWGKEFVALIRSLPVIPASAFLHLTLMMNYCVSQENLVISDISYQTSKIALQNTHLQTDKVTQNVWSWQDEQDLINIIREGNIARTGTLFSEDSLAHMLQSQFRISASRSRYAAVVLIAQCARSAVEGGLLYDVAVELSDFYTQSVDDCRFASEISIVVQTMFEDYVHRVHKCQSLSGLSKPIRNCCEYIRQHVEEPLTVSILAKRFGYADYYLTHKFKEETGQYLRDYIQNAKIERAKFLLTNSNISIQQISDALHFGSRNYFSASFRKITGMSPAEFKKENQICP